MATKTKNVQFTHAKLIDTPNPNGYNVATHHRLLQSEFVDEKTWLQYKTTVHLPHCIRELQQRIDDYKQRIIEIENPELAEKSKFENQLLKDMKKLGMNREQYAKHLAALLKNA